MTGVIHAAGVSPSQAPPATTLAVDLYGTVVVLEKFGDVSARGGAGVVIASQSGYRLGALTAEQNAALAITPAQEAGWFDQTPAVDYQSTHKGEPFRGHDVSLNRLSDLILKLVTTPGLHMRGSLWVSHD